MPTGERNSAAVFVSVSTTENNNFCQVLCISCAKFIHQHNKSCFSGNFWCAPDKGVLAFASFPSDSLGLQSNTFNCKRSRLAKTVVEKHCTVWRKWISPLRLTLKTVVIISFCRFNTRFSHRSSCSQFYRLSVYLLFERDSYFGRKTKRRLQTHFNVLLASLALTDLLTGLVVQPLQGAMTIFFAAKKKFSRILRSKFGF